MPLCLTGRTWDSGLECIVQPRLQPERERPGILRQSWCQSNVLGSEARGVWVLHVSKKWLDLEFGLAMRIHWLYWAFEASWTLTLHISSRIANSMAAGIWSSGSCTSNLITWRSHHLSRASRLCTVAMPSIFRELSSAVGSWKARTEGTFRIYMLVVTGFNSDFATGTALERENAATETFQTGQPAKVAKVTVYIQCCKLFDSPLDCSVITVNFDGQHGEGCLKWPRQQEVGDIYAHYIIILLPRTGSPNDQLSCNKISIFACRIRIRVASGKSPPGCL